MRKEIKILAIVCFSLIMGALVTALVSDAIIVGQAILGFVLALFIAVITFIVGFFLVIVSCILIFGIYLLDSEGFWPVTWAETAFNDVMKDYQVTQSQINTLIIIRIVLLVICISVLIMSIIVTKHVKKIKKQDPSIKVKPTKGFALTSHVLSIMGIVSALGIMAVLSFVI